MPKCSENWKIYNTRGHSLIYKIICFDTFLTQCDGVCCLYKIHDCQFFTSPCPVIKCKDEKSSWALWRKTKKKQFFFHLLLYGLSLVSSKYTKFFIFTDDRQMLLTTRRSSSWLCVSECYTMVPVAVAGATTRMMYKFLCIFHFTYKGQHVAKATTMQERRIKSFEAITTECKEKKIKSWLSGCCVLVSTTKRTI